MDSASDFKPYGMIDTLSKHILYQNAREETKGKDTREHQASALYCAIILPYFQNPIYTYCPEYPPAPHSTLRMDHSHQYVVTGEQKLRPLMFAEIKRAGYKLSAAKDQVERYCKSYVDHHKKRCASHPEELKIATLYAIGVCGIKYKFWVYHPIPKVLTSLGGNTSDYLGPGNENDAVVIKACIQHIQNQPPFGHDISVRRDSGDDHSEYSQGFGGPIDKMISSVIAQGYLPFELRDMERENGIVFYNMVNSQGKAIVVKSDEWRRSKVIVGGEEVDYCFTFVQEETGEKYYVWRLEAVTNVRRLPPRAKTGDISTEIDHDSEDSVTDIDPDVSIEVFFDAIEHGKEN